MSEHGILVGITGPHENTPALEWSAAEAGVRKTTVTLVHAVHQAVPPLAPSVLIAPEPVLDIGRRLAHQVAAEFTGVAGEDVQYEQLVREGSPAKVLTQLSSDAELVVLAHRRRSALRRIMTGSTAVAVAASADCPVVSVPDGWSAHDSGEGPAWVTVGVHETGAPSAVLRAGFQAAVSHRRPLRLVHGWRLDAYYDEAIARRVDSEWADAVEQEVRSAVDPLAQQHPDVDLDIEVRHQWPADVLAELSSTSALLVVGRHGQQAHVPARLGSIARTAIRTAACPVMVVSV